MDLQGANPANNQGQIVESILRAQHTVLSVSSLVPEYYQVAEVHLSLPAVVSRSGVEWILHLPLDNTETTAVNARPPFCAKPWTSSTRPREKRLPGNWIEQSVSWTDKCSG